MIQDNEGVAGTEKNEIDFVFSHRRPEVPAKKTAAGFRLASDIGLPPGSPKVLHGITLTASP